MISQEKYHIATHFYLVVALKRKTLKGAKKPKAKEQPMARQIKPANVLISTIANQITDRLSRKVFLSSFLHRNLSFLSSLGLFVSVPWSLVFCFEFST